MKRIANDVAVRTICYTMSGHQRIRIIDHSSQYDAFGGKNGTVVFDGLEKDTYGRNDSKYFDSKVWGISVDSEGTIVFDVFTKFEQYK